MKVLFLEFRLEGFLNTNPNFCFSQIGLQGEHLGLYKADGSDNVTWLSTSKPPKKQPLTWYKVNTWRIIFVCFSGKTWLLSHLGYSFKYTFVQVVVDPPLGNEPVGLDMIHMGKGLAWLNGEEIGRYWPIKSSIHDKCVEECDYRGNFLPNKCRTGCGEPTQRWYGKITDCKLEFPNAFFFFFPFFGYNCSTTATT